VSLSAASLNSSQARSVSPVAYISKLARKRMEAARIRHQREKQQAVERLNDKRNRISERIPMPRPAVIREHLDHGTHYTLLDWNSGRRIGEFAADTAARLAKVGAE
jgi:hypothetical protein